MIAENWRYRMDIEQNTTLNQLRSENAQLQDQLQTQNNYIKMMEEKLRDLQK